MDDSTPEPEHLAVTRTAYDTVAADYTRLLADALADSPYDRATLSLFAELVIRDGGGPVAEVGCGPGRITGHLAGLGIDVSGYDLSPGMVDHARAAYPHLSFEVAPLARLPRPDGGLAGLVAWYSLIHTPPAEFPAAVAEFARVLRPGGHLLLAFQLGTDERLRREQAYGHAVTYDVYRLAPDRVVDDLRAGGFEERARLVRRAEGCWETTPQVCVLATRGG